MSAFNDQELGRPQDLTGQDSLSTGAAADAGAEDPAETQPSWEGARHARRAGDGIPSGRLRRTAPVASLVARTTGEAVVKAMRRKVSGREVTVNHERAAERYAQRSVAPRAL